MWQRWYHWTAEINGTTNTMTTDKPYRNFLFYFFSGSLSYCRWICFISRMLRLFFWCFWSIAHSLENNEWTNVLPLNWFCVITDQQWSEWIFIWFILFVFFHLRNLFFSTNQHFGINPKEQLNMVIIMGSFSNSAPAHSIFR